MRQITIIHQDEACFPKDDSVASVHLILPPVGHIDRERNAFSNRCFQNVMRHAESIGLPRWLGNVAK